MNESKLWAVDLELASTFRHVAGMFYSQFPGSSLSVAQGFRTPTMQNAAKGAGASPFNGTTSWSKHQAYPAMALDFAVIEDGKYVTDGTDPRYAWVGRKFEDYGFIWGGRWHNPDYDHVEVPGLGLRSPEQAQEALASYEQALSDRSVTA